MKKLTRDEVRALFRKPGLRKVKPARIRAKVRPFVRAHVLAQPDTDGRVEAFAAGHVTFEELMATPVWRRYVQSQMRRRPRGTWVDEEDLFQELQLTVFESFGTNPPAESAEPIPGYEPRIAFDKAKSKNLPKFVSHQALYWLREVMRSTAKVAHRKGEGNVARCEILIPMMGNRHGDKHSQPSRMIDNMNSIPADQEQVVDRKMAIERLDLKVRDAVAELFESGSFDRAVRKVRELDAKSARKALKRSVKQVLQEIR